MNIGDYADPNYSMVSNRPHRGTAPNCDNYWLFTAQAHKLGYDSFLDVSCYSGAYISPGLFHRYPGRLDDISQDELFGASYIDSELAWVIVYHGRVNNWCFNAEHPDKFDIRYWYARYLNFIPFIKHRAGDRVGVLGQLSWSIACILSALPAYDNTSGKLLMWIQLEPMAELPICKYAVKLWKFLMNRMYKQGLKEIMTIYFGPEHPFIEVAPTMF